MGVAGASVEECSGMQNIDLKVGGTETAVTESASGDLIATIPMTISAGPVTCTGHACASGSACGISLNPAVVVKPTMSITDVSIKAVMSLGSGSGVNSGKACMAVKHVMADAGQFTWG